jgi:hypothetical protein
MTTRREVLIVLGAGALAAPLASFAQQRTGETYRIGYLAGGPGIESRQRHFARVCASLDISRGKISSLIGALPEAREICFASLRPSWFVSNQTAL